MGQGAGEHSVESCQWVYLDCGVVVSGVVFDDMWQCVCGMVVVMFLCGYVVPLLARNAAQYFTVQYKLKISSILR